MVDKYVKPSLPVLTVTNQIDGQVYPCALSWLAKTDLVAMQHLQDLVVASLEDADVYVPLTPEELLAILEGKGLALGAYVQGELIGWRLVLFPGVREDNLGHDLGFLPEQLEQVCQLEAALIHPAYRGQGLQRILTRHALHCINKAALARYVLLTAAPTNLPSLINSFRNGLYIVRLLYKYNQRLRYILFRDLEASPIFEKHKAKVISSLKIEQQLELLAQGFYGYKLDWQAGLPVIHYAQKK